MKNLFLKKSNADTGIGIMGISLITLILMLVFMLYSFQENELSVLAYTMRDGMDVVCLSAIIPDEQAMKDSMKDAVEFNPDNGFEVGIGSASADNFDLIIKKEESYSRFKQIFASNIASEASVLSISDIVINEVIFFTISGNDVIRYTYNSMGKCSTKVHRDGLGSVTSPNGILIDDATVYAKVTFSYTDHFGFKHKNLSVQNCKAARFY